jgi:hypothetical protein
MNGAIHPRLCSLYGVLLSTKRVVPNSTFTYLPEPGKLSRYIDEAISWKAGVLFPAGARNFSLLHTVQTGSGAHPASSPMGTGDSFPGGKAVEA